MSSFFINNFSFDLSTLSQSRINFQHKSIEIFTSYWWNYRMSNLMSEKMHAEKLKIPLIFGSEACENHCFCLWLKEIVEKNSEKVIRKNYSLATHRATDASLHCRFRLNERKGRKKNVTSCNFTKFTQFTKWKTT